MPKINNYTLANLVNMSFNVVPDESLKEKFIERTQKHINLVNKYAARIGKGYPDHDASKLTTLLDGYCFFSKPEEERTKEENEVLDLVTLIHITQSSHHPEYWTNTDLTGFTRKNTNPNGIIDATEMNEDSLLELCADWSSCSEEFGNSPFEWLQKVDGVRWLFTSEQKKFIRETLKQMWID